jgi:hypothetical protein
MFSIVAYALCLHRDALVGIYLLSNFRALPPVEAFLY